MSVPDAAYAVQRALSRLIPVSHARSKTIAADVWRQNDPSVDLIKVDGASRWTSLSYEARNSNHTFQIRDWLAHYNASLEATYDVRGRGRVRRAPHVRAATEKRRAANQFLIIGQRARDEEVFTHSRRHCGTRGWTG